MITLNESEGLVTFEFFRPNASNVQLAATFNDWSTCQHPMKSDGRGWWRVTLPIDPGDHAFQYVVDHHDWFADFAAHGVEMNEHGGWQSLLTVPPASIPTRAPELLRVIQRTDDRLSPLPFQSVENGPDRGERTRKAA